MELYYSEMSTIFLTGASGFVGSNIKNSPYLDSYNFRFYDRNNIDLKGISAVFHFAGIAHDLDGFYTKEDYLEVNVELTKRVYKEFLNSDASLFVYLSSIKAVADNFEGSLDENTGPNPQTFYGISKLIAEEFISSNPIPNGKRFIILRPALIYGKQNKGNLMLLNSLIKKIHIWPLNSFNNARSFCYIENLCFALNEFLQNEQIESGVYNICDDESISTNDLVAGIARINKISFLNISLPKKIINAIACLGSILNLPFNKITLNKLTQNYVVNNSKLVKSLGKSLPFSLEKGLELTFKKED